MLNIRKLWDATSYADIYISRKKSLNTSWYHGDSLVLMPEDVRNAIYAERRHDFSGDVCIGLTFQDLDEEAIGIFRKTWSEYSGNRRISSLSAVQLLADCGALTGS